MSHGRRTARYVAAFTLALAVSAPAPNTAIAAPAASVPLAHAAHAPAAAKQGGWQPRPEQYTTSVTTRDVPIRMDDGVVLRGDLIRPASTNGSPVSTKLPVLVTVTAYNKTVLGAGAGAVLAGTDPKYFVKRGYALLTVDATTTASTTTPAPSSRPRR